MLSSICTRSTVAIIILCCAVPSAARAADAVGTFSIVAYDPATGELGVAVQSRAFSVGAGVAWAEAGVGAVATQASTNESFGPRGLELLRAGLNAGDTLDHLIEHDEHAANRQLAIVDARGGVSAHTGASCLDWAGHRLGTGVSCQGNILAGAQVADDMLAAFQNADGELAHRLLAALVAGQAAGGDKRGMQSAALLVVRPSAGFPEYRTRYVSLRVEDHPDPINELLRVFAYHEATDLVRAHLRYAEDYEAAGDPAAAELERRRVGQILERALARGESDAGLLNGLAWYTALADVYLDEALVAARRAAELEPEEHEILDTLAEVHFRRGEVGEAITVGQRALALDPTSTYLQEQLSRFEAARDAQ